MKKFISMVMAAAMVVSLVPATAFAASGSAVIKTGGVEEYKEGDVNEGDALSGSEIQIVITDVNASSATNDEFEIELNFDNAELDDTTLTSATTWTNAKVARTGVDMDGEVGTDAYVPADIKVEPAEDEDTTLTVVIKETTVNFKVGDVIILPFGGATPKMILTDDSEGTEVTVEVTGAFGETEAALPLLTILAEGLDVTVSGKPVEVAEEDLVELKTVAIESVVGAFDDEDEIKVKVKDGFEFVNVKATSPYIGKDSVEKTNGSITAYDADGNVAEGSVSVKTNSVEEDEFVLVVSGTDVKEIKLVGLEVEAVSANAGEIGSIVASCKGYEGDSDEAVEVIADAVTMTVDEDEDVPVMYSGVNVDEDGLQTDADHNALEVTIEESVVDAWDTVGKWSLTLPEGVYAVEGSTAQGNGNFTWNIGKTGKADAALMAAYAEGDYEAFEFGRRDMQIKDDAKAKLTINLDLVAEPEFEGDVVLTLAGDNLETQEVVIAKFVKAYTVEAAQNDLVIDYKETVVPTSVVIKEAEMGLWDDNTSTGAKFAFFVENIEVEDAAVAVDEDSDMTIEDKTNLVNNEGYKAIADFTVDEESDEAAAAVTVSDVELYMERNIPAGAYDLYMTSSIFTGFMNSEVWGADTYNTDTAKETVAEVYYDGDAVYEETVKEAWVNVITAGRDKDDASFTKTVVVPVGAMEIVAGEDVVALDVPAYINAAGYTMLPVRAVAVALGIHTNNVIWDQATKTVTILYGQRIITMQVGSKVINVNGSAIPASAAVEIVNGRTFLGLRDLATALGVTDITWDAATQTATLNGNK